VGWGCKPTYEGLKYFYVIQARCTRACCKPTYEGLKFRFDPEFGTWRSRLQAYL